MMFLTFFELIANSLTFQIVNTINLFLRHKFAPEVIGIVDFVARELGLVFVADATFVYHLFTLHALVIVALLDALVLATWQKSFAE